MVGVPESGVVRPGSIAWLSGADGSVEPPLVVLPPVEAPAGGAVVPVAPVVPVVPAVPVVPVVLVADGVAVDPRFDVPPPPGVEVGVPAPDVLREAADEEALGFDDDVTRGRLEVLDALGVGLGFVLGLGVELGFGALAATGGATSGLAPAPNAKPITVPGAGS